MKANVNYNLKGDEEPGIEGRAQNPNFTLFWARPLNPVAPIATLQNIAIYSVFATLAPQKHPKRSILAFFGPTMSATRQFGCKIGSNLAPCQQNLKPDDAKKGYHEPSMSTKAPQVKMSPEL